MKLIQVFSRTTISMLVMIASPLSWMFSTHISNYDPIQASTTTISFQDGVSPTINYAGTQDTSLSENDPYISYGDDSRLRIDGDDPPGSKKDLAILLRWDLTTIPKFSPVQSAKITLHFDEREDARYSNNQYSLLALKRYWTENQATWFKNLANSSWGVPGALGATDRTVGIGSFIPSQGQEQTIELTSTGIGLVQAWVNDPAQNYGVIISSLINTDGADFLSSESPTKTYRPKLTISYQPKETISPAPYNTTTGSLFRYPKSPKAGPSLTRPNYSFAGNSILLELNKTRTVLDWLVTGPYYVGLGLFDPSTNISVTVLNSNGVRVISYSVNPQQIDRNRGYLFRFGMGQPLGSYTVNLAQGTNRQATFQFTTTVDNSPTMAITPSCASPGNTFYLFMEGLTRDTPLDIYHHDHDKDLYTYWTYETSLPAPRVNERGEAQYSLFTQSNDRKDDYLIITRDQGAEVRFSLPCK